jgi:tripartite-type tricarboxylate transporter receptor subunit TctC
MIDVRPRDGSRRPTRVWRQLAAALVLAGAATGAAAQAWPAKPVRLVVPYPTGGGADLATRTIAEGLSAQLGQQVLVENRGGAAGIVGTDFVAKAAPDGYTLLLTPDVLFTTYPFLYPKLPYAFRDFAPVAVTTYLSMAIFAHPSVSANNLRELVAQMKAKPQSLPYGTPGNGTPMHLAGELLSQLGNLPLVHIPYKGGGPAATDLLGGQLPLAIVGVSSGVQHAKAGKLKALAVLDAKRVPAMPDVPTVAESGFPGYEVTTWFGIYAPAGTPEAIINRLNTEIARALQVPALRDRLAAGGQDVAGGGPDDVRRRVARESAQWGKVIRDAGIRVEQ